MSKQRLAIHGGTPTFTEGQFDWPIADSRIQNRLEESLRTGDWGKYDSKLTEELIAQLQRLFQMELVLPCSSGTIGVELAIRGTGVKPGDEVILAAYDFPGNFRAIEAVGARAVLVDVEPDSWTIDADQIEQVCTSDTRAVLVSHLHGNSPDMPRICEVARQVGIKVIEDTCQAPGGQLAGQPLGSFGDVSVLSFGGSKLLSAGRGGAVLTRDASIHQRAKIFASRGNDAFPLSQLQAAVLLPQLESLEEVAAKRHRGWTTLNSLIQNLSLSPQSQPLSNTENRTAAYKIPLRVGASDRHDWLASLLAEGIPVGEGFRGFANRSSRRCRKPLDLPNSRDAVEQTLLIHHPILLQGKEQIEKLADAIQRIHTHLEPDHEADG